jgi:hypothetical protein
MFRGMSNPNKVLIAQAVVDDPPASWLLDLNDRVAEVVQFIHKANHMPLPSAVPDAPSAAAVTDEPVL